MKVSQEKYHRHIYVRLASFCANSLKEEASVLNFRNTSLLIRYLLKRRDRKGPLYSATEMKALKKFKSWELCKQTRVVSIKLQESLYSELNSEWRSRGYSSLPSYVARILESRYLPKETRSFYEES